MRRWLSENWPAIVVIAIACVGLYLTYDPRFVD